MANIVDVDMESCEPDSTVEIVEVEDHLIEIQVVTPLQAMNHQLVERQHLCANMVAASMRDRERVRSQLDEARKQRESVMADLCLVLRLRENATQSCTEAKASLQEAKKKRLALMNEIDAEKMWRPPSAEMSLKKQQAHRNCTYEGQKKATTGSQKTSDREESGNKLSEELRERVEHMRTILGIGKIRTPDD